MSDKKHVKKNVPSFLETGLEQLLYNTIGKLIPENVTPNQITFIGAIGALFGIICASLSTISVLWLIGTIAGLIMHVVCDDLDGFVARRSNKTSSAGAYFDLLTDILNLTFLLIALAFAGVIKFQIAIFLVPVYPLIIFTSMNEIHYINEFSFPVTGPLESHLVFIGAAIAIMITGIRDIVSICGYSFTIADLIFIVGGVVMYIEMIRLQITLFIKLKKQDN